MKHIKFTYVDAVTGIPVTEEPAANGPAFPPVPGLEFSWARESQYPTHAPEFFGTCPSGSDTDVPGVLGVFEQSDWETMRDDEMAARAGKFDVIRRQAYRDEADPIYFKWQRGEATEAQWLDKVAELKARWPD